MSLGGESDKWKILLIKGKINEHVWGIEVGYGKSLKHSQCQLNKLDIPLRSCSISRNADNNTNIMSPNLFYFWDVFVRLFWPFRKNQVLTDKNALHNMTESGKWNTCLFGYIQSFYVTSKRALSSWMESLPSGKTLRTH